MSCNWNENNGLSLKIQKPIVYTNVSTILQLETAQFVNWLMINILWSEISAKFRLLSINNRFCHFKRKGYCSHFSCHGNGIWRKVKSYWRILLTCKISNRSNLKLSWYTFIFPLFFSCADMMSYWCSFKRKCIWGLKSGKWWRSCLWLWISISQVMVHSFGFSMLFHLSLTCIDPGIPFKKSIIFVFRFLIIILRIQNLILKKDMFRKAYKQNFKRSVFSDFSSWCKVCSLPVKNRLL